jgi:K+-sensing histidine kinase KdpD
MTLRKADAEKQSKENQLRMLAEETHKQEALLSRLLREKKLREETSQKLQQEFATEEERAQAGKNLIGKLQQALEAIYFIFAFHANILNSVPNLFECVLFNYLLWPKCTLKCFEYSTD